MEIDFDSLYEFHGHRCPMSTMGARLGIAAMNALGVTKSDQFRLRGVYRARNCALDGVQFVTGCTLGNGNLECEDEARASFSLDRRDGGGVTATVSDDALSRFMRHKEKRAAFERGGRAPGIEDELKRDFDALVEWVQAAPDEDLLVITVK